MIKHTTITTLPISDLEFLLEHELTFNPIKSEKISTYGTIDTTHILQLDENNHSQYLENLKQFKLNCDNKNIEFLFTLPSEIMPKGEYGVPHQLFWAKGLNESKKRTIFYFTFNTQEQKFIEYNKNNLLNRNFSKLFVDTQINDRSFHDYLFTFESIESRQKSSKYYYSENLLSLIDKLTEANFMVKDTGQTTQIKLIPSNLSERQSFNQQIDLFVVNQESRNLEFKDPFEFFEKLNVTTINYNTIYDNTAYGLEFHKIKHDFGYDGQNLINDKKLNFSSLTSKKEKLYVGEYIDYEIIADYDNYYKKGNIYSYEETYSIYQYKDMLSRKLYTRMLNYQIKNDLEGRKSLLKEHLKSPYFDINYNSKINSDIAHFIFNNDLDELMIDFVDNNYDIEKNKSLKNQIDNINPNIETKKFAIYEKIKLERIKAQNKLEQEKNNKIKI